MFEPLREIVGEHSSKLYDLLRSIDGKLGQMVEGVEAEVQYDQFTTRSDRAVVGEDGTAIIELTPSEGFSWDIRRVALTASETGNCAVYVGSVAPENLVDAFREPKIVADRGRYFVPRGTSLVFHFYEQEVGHTVTANIQAEQLIPVVKVGRSVTGHSLESLDHPRVPPVPSGAPLSEVQVG